MFSSSTLHGALIMHAIYVGRHPCGPRGYWEVGHLVLELRASLDMRSLEPNQGKMNAAEKLLGDLPRSQHLAPAIHEGSK